MLQDSETYYTTGKEKQEHKCLINRIRSHSKVSLQPKRMLALSIL